MAATWLKRAQDALRSIVLGPYNAKDATLARLFGGGPTVSGVSVNEYTALNLSAVWAAVGIISGDMAALPLNLYRRLPNGDKEPYDAHPLYDLLHRRPNPEMTSFTFRQTLQSHVLTWGNGYAEIERDAAGRPVALWPLTPDRVYPYREPNGAIVYRVTRDPRPGSTGIAFDELEPEAILHIHGLGFDGICGYSVIAKFRESLGLTAALERFGAQFFGNGANMTGVLSHPKALSPTAKKYLEESLDEHHTRGKARRALVLEEGMTWTQMGVPPDDGQFLQSRVLQVSEVARMFNIPPHKLRELSHATFSNIEHESISYVTGSLMPWLVNWEMELESKLIRPLERRQQFIKFNVNALLRGDTPSRYAAYATGKNWGWLSSNDIRYLEDMNSIGEQGDIYLMPGNMLDANGPMPTRGSNAPQPAPASDTPTGDAASDEAPARHAELQGQIAVIAHELVRLREGLPSDPLGPLAAVPSTLAGLLERVADLSTRHASAEATASETATEIGALKVAVDALRADVATPRHDPTLRADVAATLGETERIREDAHAAMSDTAARWTALTADMAAVRDAVTAPPPPPEPLPIFGLMTAEQAAELIERVAALTEFIRAAPPEPAAEPEPAAPVNATQARDRARLITGHRAAIEDAVARCVRRETLKARRAAKSPDKLRAWIAEFYPRQQPIFESILLPTIHAHLGAISSEREAADVTRELVAAHLETSRAQFHALLDTAPSDLAGAVGELMDRWERERPGARADALMEEELIHA